MKFEISGSIPVYEVDSGIPPSESSKLDDPICAKGSSDWPTGGDVSKVDGMSEMLGPMFCFSLDRIGLHRSLF